MTEKDAMYTQLRYLPPLPALFLAFASGQTTTYTTEQGGTNQLIPTAQSNLPNALPGVVIESWRYDPLQKHSHCIW